jgi:serine/threonine-protein kinase HipA
MTSEVELYVMVYLPDSITAVPAGVLRLIEEGSRTVTSTFVYGTRYISRQNALEIDPVSLPFRTVPRQPGEKIIPAGGLELFGAIRDATPDAWGRRVIENTLNVGPNTLPESAYLLNAGSNRSGALDIRASQTSEPQELPFSKVVDLQYLLDAAARVEEGEHVPEILKFHLGAGVSMGGARPKAVLEDQNIQWLAKFPSRGDRFNNPRVEYATLKLAERCGLNVPALQMVLLPDGREILLTRRFDRQTVPGGYSRIHFLSALTLTGLHEQDSPDSSYLELVQAIRNYGAPSTMDTQLEELFGRMVFNILVSNDDDHLRNHGFLWADSGYNLSPLYDVVPKPQGAYERFLHLAVGDYGRLATLDNAFTKHAAYGLTKGKAGELIERIAREVRGWKGCFEEHGIKNREIIAVESAFRRPNDVGLEKVLKMAG